MKWKRGLKILGAIIVLAASSLVGASWIERRSRQTQEEKVRDELANFRVDEPSRPPVFASAREGNGWEMAMPALKAIFRLRYGDLSQAKWPRWPSDPEPTVAAERIDDYLGKLKPHFDALRTAFTCREFDAELPDMWKKRWAGTPSPGLWPARPLLFWSAQALHSRHRDREAVDLLLIDLGLSHETERNPEWQAGGGSDLEALSLLRKILADSRMSAAELESLCRELERLEAGLPDLLKEARGELLLAQAAVLGRLNRESPWEKWERRWEELREPVRCTPEDYLTHARQSAERLEAIGKLPARERPEAMKKAIDEGCLTGWVLIGPPPPSLDERLSIQLCEQEDLQLARIAAALLWYEIEHRGFPTALEDLVPRYLAALPVEPHQGLAWSYSIQGDRACVKAGCRDASWSVFRKP